MVFEQETTSGYRYRTHNVRLREEIIHKLDAIIATNLYNNKTYGKVISELISDTYRCLRLAGQIPSHLKEESSNAKRKAD